jgi:hypothetical protein
MLTYSLHEIPFSIPGSFLTISARNPSGTHRLLYGTSSRRVIQLPGMTANPAHYFELALLRDGVEVPYTWTAQPHRLDLQVEGGGSLVLTFADSETLIFRAEGVTLRLLPCKGFSSHWRPDPDTLAAIDWAGRSTHLLRSGPGGTVQFTPTQDNADLYGPPTGWVDFSGPLGAIRYRLYEDLWRTPFPDIDVALAACLGEYEAWLAKIPAVPERYQAAAEQAWFILWNGQVPASGRLTRPVIFMSKFWMNAVWAWDNCFNALAVAEADPQLAWNHLLLFFDHQDPNGMVPDMIFDMEVLYQFTKPPIHGWTIRKLVAKLGLEPSLPYLAQLYEPLCRLTNWWYTYRDFDGDGMCQYHHGNDSGWDNATLFDQGYPTEGSDLAAHLVLECEGLAWMAGVLGKPQEAVEWQRRADAQLAALLRLQVKDGRFFSPLDGKNEAPETQSLLNSIAMVLGHRLPPEIRQNLVADLGPGGPFLTAYGLATEAPASPKYDPDGYWRGPIWAPSTHLIFDGLVDAGETALARTIAERFCELCLHTPGFWENYDALTGQGLRCPAYSWTAAAFLEMAGWLLEK